MLRAKGHANKILNRLESDLRNLNHHKRNLVRFERYLSSVYKMRESLVPVFGRLVRIPTVDDPLLGKIGVRKIIDYVRKVKRGYWG